MGGRSGNGAEGGIQGDTTYKGLDNPNICVYGGGKDIEQWCHDRGIVYLAEYINKAKKIQKGIRE